MKTKIATAFLIAILFAPQLILSAELDPAYLKNFGTGIILTSSKAFPAKDKCDMSLFDYSGRKFNIIAGVNVELNFRILLKDGKTYGFYVDQVKKANSKKLRTRTGDFMRVYFYVSHENGSEVSKTWPKTITDKPDWKALFTRETDITDEMAKWATSGLQWQDILYTSSALQDWLQDARKGYRIYMYVVVGFIRESPENNYWDEALYKYVTPIEYVESEPLAAGTIEITGSNNPLLLWNYKVISMPPEMDGHALGYATIYKNNEERKKVKFTVKPQGNANRYSFMIMDVIEGTGFFGGFDVTATTVEAAFDSAMYQLIERSLQIGDLPE
jgi:hypothetical protein